MKRFVLAFVCLFPAMELAAACGTAPSTELAAALLPQAPGLHEDALLRALDSVRCADRVRRRDVITIIDYALPSTEPRLFVFDLTAKRVLFRELVAHGKNSGDVMTTAFSNSPGSLATSLGLFVTEETYDGSNGYSLRLRGLDRGLNDRARERAIVLHGAYYVSREAIRVLGRLGRSSGCPAVRAEIAEDLINTIKGGTAIFAYGRV